MYQIVQKSFFLSRRVFLRNTFKYNFAANNIKILENWEIPIDAQIQLGNALLGAHSCRMFASLLKDNFMYMNDSSISYAMKRIYELDLDLDESFYNDMVPLLRDYVSQFNREHNRALSEIIQYSGQMNVQDDQLWLIFEKKLIEERLYRYIPIDNMVQLLYGLSKSSYGSKQLLTIIENVLIKHRLWLSEEQCQLCLEAFKDKEYQSPLLYKMLENPGFDIESELKSQQKKLSQ